MATKKNRTKKHWAVFVLACLMAGGSMGINMNAIGVFYTPVAESLGMLVGSFAFHSTLAALALSIVSLIIPQLISKIGFKPMILIGSILAAVSTIAMAFTTNIWMFYILGTLRGIGSGMFGIIPYTIMLNNWFEEKNGLVISISASFSGVIGMIMSPVFNWTINTLGWQTSFIIMGILLFVSSFPTFLLPFKLNPEDEGLLAYGASSDTHKDAVKDTEDQKASNSTFKIMSVSFITLVVLALFHTFSTGLIQNLPGFTETVGLGSAIGATLLSAAMFGNILFKVVLGSLEERLGSVLNVVISVSLTIVAVLVHIFFRVPIVLIIFAFIFGASYYIPAVGLPLMTNYFYGREQANKVYPIVSFVALASGAVAMSAVGFIYDFTGSYIPAFWTVLVLEVITLAVVLFAAKRVQGQEKTE